LQVNVEVCRAPAATSGLRLLDGATGLPRRSDAFEGRRRHRDTS
jgi:hypothetical protein